jgi:hypothetical protein
LRHSEILEGKSVTSKHQALLAKLVRTLVEEWGHDEVQKALAQLSNVSSGHVSPERASRQASRWKKPTAVQQVTRLDIPDGQRETLLALAAKFDRKQFLPSVVDIREFLAMRGEDSGGVNDRIDGFRRLLRSFLELPAERLEHLVSSTRYSGPARLGPLSDAIRSTGEAIRRRGEVPEPEQNS